MYGNIDLQALMRRINGQDASPTTAESAPKQPDAPQGGPVSKAMGLQPFGGGSAIMDPSYWLPRSPFMPGGSGFGGGAKTGKGGGAAAQPTPGKPIGEP
jgi:hypothetical protein